MQNLWLLLPITQINNNLNNQFNLKRVQDLISVNSKKYAMSNL